MIMEITYSRVTNYSLDLSAKDIRQLANHLDITVKELKELAEAGDLMNEHSDGIYDWVCRNDAGRELTGEEDAEDVEIEL
jgi:hypothetical protein